MEPVNKKVQDYPSGYGATLRLMSLQAQHQDQFLAKIVVEQSAWVQIPHLAENRLSLHLTKERIKRGCPSG